MAQLPSHYANSANQWTRKWPVICAAIKTARCCLQARLSLTLSPVEAPQSAAQPISRGAAAAGMGQVMDVQSSREPPHLLSDRPVSQHPPGALGPVPAPSRLYSPGAPQGCAQDPGQAGCSEGHRAPGRGQDSCVPGSVRLSAAQPLAAPPLCSGSGEDQQEHCLVFAELCSPIP